MSKKFLGESIFGDSGILSFVPWARKSDWNIQSEVHSH